jgi:hypothetical protein
VTEIACHSLTLCLSGRSRARNGRFSRLPAGLRASGTGPSQRHLSCSVARDSTPRPGIYAPPPARARSNSNACAAAQAVPVAVLCCCTAGPCCSNLASDQVELRGLEPLTPCLQIKGGMSTSVHHRWLRSLDVHPDPYGSRSVAVLSCCTHHPGPGRPRYRAIVRCAPPRSTSGPTLNRHAEIGCSRRNRWSAGGRVIWPGWLGVSPRPFVRRSWIVWGRAGASCGTRCPARPGPRGWG